LRQGTDRTREIDPGALSAARVDYTSDPEALRDADFHIIAVPTPVDADKQPDLTALRSAAEIVGGILKRGDIVVFESTVYPGLTEEFCLPILSARSGLSDGVDFHVGYSPERINPGDGQHSLGAVVKVVAACDEPTLDIVAAVYASIVPAGVYRAPSIRVAEAAKVIENTQRDLNIALMNELAMLFARMGIDTVDVVRTAATKWNFMPFSPGLVGGHCIGVDPYYLTYKARLLGHEPGVILAGRATNDGMGRHVAMRVVQRLRSLSITGRDPVVTVLGFTFKENIPDTRNSGVFGLYQALKAEGMEVQVHDSNADRDQCMREYGVALAGLDTFKIADAVILAVPHREYLQQGWALMTRLLVPRDGVVFDVRSGLDRSLRPEHVTLERL
jgi:UDP-N-acetyl-D-galactosamine dehydrogenase